MIINNDSLHALKELEADSIDAVITDPPYGYSFMGKDWDKAVPSVEIWQECLRVLKPGGWCMVMSAPRSDVQNAMISRLMEAGFRLDFTPIYWTYASGFPKAGNVGKLVDKRMGVEREVVGYGKRNPRDKKPYGGNETNGLYEGGLINKLKALEITEPRSDQAKALDGSYAGFQPKPAVEVIIVAMKPLSEKTYVDQALKNGKGITWLDDCRVPTDTPLQPRHLGKPRIDTGIYSKANELLNPPHENGRFPANLLVSDDVLNDGVTRTAGKNKLEKGTGGIWKKGTNLPIGPEYGDSGSYSRYFDLDAWARERLPGEQAMTFPFAIFPKASKSEKNKGLEAVDPKPGTHRMNASRVRMENGVVTNQRAEQSVNKNHHPTVKPLKLMSYLITLTTRPGDTVLDPFVGSGTTVVAAEQLGRKGIGIEREPEYAEIARARVEAAEKVESEDDNQLQLV